MSAPKTLKLPPNLQSWLRVCPGSNYIRCSTHGRWPQRRPCDAASDGLTLAAGPTTYPVYKLCVLVGVWLPERNSTGILVGPDSVCRQYRTSSATLSVDGGTTNWSRINWIRFVSCCRSTSVEQSTASPLLNLQIVFFLKKELKSFLFGLSFRS